ncbi:hypothetical protein KVT40_001604 [Elsinoe batatas]|uniref:Uncharacterized protein n=1 Tax=Elsinoe batatas TaxID=2601811 RepID=A0A8K0PF70_9PEZI|nr:hypothetical protein KVT40_001604 [Elsinoe batatas]
MHVSFLVATIAIASSVNSATHQGLVLDFGNSTHQIHFNNGSHLDRAPSIEDERPWAHGRNVTTNYLLAALFPYSAVTLEAVITPLRVIARAFLRREKSVHQSTDEYDLQISSVPTYADLTDQGWRAAVHGHVHLGSPMSDDWYGESKHLNSTIERLLVRATMNKTHHSYWRKYFYQLNEAERTTAVIRAYILRRAPVKGLGLRAIKFDESCFKIDLSDISEYDNSSIPLYGSTDREGGFNEDIIIPAEWIERHLDPYDSNTVAEVPYRVCPKDGNMNADEFLRRDKVPDVYSDIYLETDVDPNNSPDGHIDSQAGPLNTADSMHLPDPVSNGAPPSARQDTVDNEDADGKLDTEHDKVLRAPTYGDIDGYNISQLPRIYLIPPNGLTVISDVDDVLRVAEV